MIKQRMMKKKIFIFFFFFFLLRKIPLLPLLVARVNRTWITACESRFPMLKFNGTIILQRCPRRIQQEPERCETSIQSESATGDFGSSRYRGRCQSCGARVLRTKETFQIRDDPHKEMLVVYIPEDHSRRSELQWQIFIRYRIRQRLRDVLFPENRREEESSWQFDLAAVQETRKEEVHRSLPSDTGQNRRISLDRSAG